ncbi:FixH family protein [Geomonas nitrogeniifigens]|uniref:FixH family protein n=1 Tax=Geomonas diazotrophica TaxID=2843197 RepID=A0ABX8JEZ0_9BACT|nr:FixH family protein [Geomonas nitrogeniifigens]QWV96313.1 FixH family protein [Geomonas nitrogeniifigens]QXE85380.1 FixH family protein [Geomonas nitrogeniifigens]
MKRRATISSCRWQLAILLLLAVFLLGMGTSMFISFERGSRVTDTDYYQNGLNYAKTRSGAYNPGLDWVMSASLAGSDLQVRVHDEKGAPVAGGSLLFQTRRGNEKEVLTLAESAPGVFVAPWPVSGQAELRGELIFTKGEAVASQKVVFFN